MTYSDRMFDALAWFNSTKQRIAGKTYGAIDVRGEQGANEVDFQLLREIDPGLATEETVSALRMMERIAVGIAKEFGFDPFLARSFMVEGAYGMLCYLEGKKITAEEAREQERLLGEETLH